MFKFYISFLLISVFVLLTISVSVTYSQNTDFVTVKDGNFYTYRCTAVN